MYMFLSTFSGLAWPGSLTYLKDKMQVELRGVDDDVAVVIATGQLAALVC